MTDAPRNDAELMSVSIVAGPAVTILLDTIGAGAKNQRTGVLTSTGKNASSTGLTFFYERPGSDPDRLVKAIQEIAEQGKIDHLIVECEPDRPPMAYASLFLAGDGSRQSLAEVASLSATAFAIGPDELLHALFNQETVSISPCFLAEQIEFVSDIFLESASGDRNFEMASSIVRVLNPAAYVSPLSSRAVDTWCQPRSATFDFNTALNASGWRKLLDGEQLKLDRDSQVTAFAYEARRPFHPERFWSLLQNQLRGVFRAKGFFWLATRMDGVGGLNLAGTELHCASAGEWWAAQDANVREVEMPERTRPEWQEPFGDRRQSFAVMAIDTDGKALQAQLDSCLLTETEMAGGPQSWQAFGDPFPSWSSHHHGHDHACDHEHGSDEHDCCHH